MDIGSETPNMKISLQSAADTLGTLFRKGYLLCEDIEYVIFPYGFYGERKQIFE